MKANDDSVEVIATVEEWHAVLQGHLQQVKSRLNKFKSAPTTRTDFINLHQDAERIIKHMRRIIDIIRYLEGMPPEKYLNKDRIL